MAEKRSYKYCVVPECKNTTKTTPDKIFINIPANPERRKQWMIAMKRKDHVSCKSVKVCCEDHFDLKEDMENYIKYRLIGGRIFLKPHAIPTKFECQKKKPHVSPEKKPQATDPKAGQKNGIKFRPIAPKPSNTSKTSNASKSSNTSKISNASKSSNTSKTSNASPKRTRPRILGSKPKRDKALNNSQNTVVWITNPAENLGGVNNVLDGTRLEEMLERNAVNVNQEDGEANQVIVYLQESQDSQALYDEIETQDDTFVVKQENTEEYTDCEQLEHEPNDLQPEAETILSTTNERKRHKGQTGNSNAKRKRNETLEYSLNKIEGFLKASLEKNLDQFDFFGKYVGSLLRKMPIEKAEKLQQDIVSLIFKP